MQSLKLVTQMAVGKVGLYSDLQARSWIGDHNLIFFRRVEDRGTAPAVVFVYIPPQPVAKFQPQIGYSLLPCLV